MRGVGVIVTLSVLGAIAAGAWVSAPLALRGSVIADAAAAGKPTLPPPPKPRPQIERVEPARPSPPAVDARPEPALPIGFSSNLVAVTSGFAGAGIVLFGALDAATDVIAVVRGPASDPVVRRKASVAGIWLNVESLRFRGVPAYYRVSSSRPIDELLPETTRASLEIGTNHLTLTPFEGRDRTDLAVWREALVRLKRDHGLYPDQSETVTVQDARLFQVPIDLPANVPVGVYQVSVHAVRDGDVVATAKAALFVEKQGIGAAIFRIAHLYGAAYGLLAVLLALLAGWTTDRIFRR